MPTRTTRFRYYHMPPSPIVKRCGNARRRRCDPAKIAIPDNLLLGLHDRARKHSLRSCEVLSVPRHGGGLQNPRQRQTSRNNEFQLFQRRGRKTNDRDPTESVDPVRWAIDERSENPSQDLKERNVFCWRKIDASSAFAHYCLSNEPARRTTLEPEFAKTVFATFMPRSTSAIRSCPRFSEGTRRRRDRKWLSRCLDSNSPYDDCGASRFRIAPVRPPIRLTSVGLFSEQHAIFIESNPPRRAIFALASGERPTDSARQVIVENKSRSAMAMRSSSSRYREAKSAGKPPLDCTELSP